MHHLCNAFGSSRRINIYFVATSSMSIQNNILKCETLRWTFLFVQVWFQNKRSKERRMKQLSQMGMRPMYPNPRKLRDLPLGMEDHYAFFQGYSGFPGQQFPPYFAHQQQPMGFNPSEWPWNSYQSEYII